MLERALREGYAVFQNYISPGTAAGVLALDHDDGTWARIFLKEKDSADESADEGADGRAADGAQEGAQDGAEDRDPDRIQLEMDDFRLMRDLPEHLIEDLEDQLGDMWKWIYPNHVAKNWVAIKSLPGGEQQALHTDYRLWERPSGGDPVDRQLLLDYSRVPATLLLAVEPNTKIHFYGWNRYLADLEDKAAIKTVTLDAGDVVLFRGDMIHAGAAYEKTNIRVHAYLCPESMDIEPDTYIVPVLQDQFPTVAQCADQGRCIFFGCKYKPNGEHREENLKRHIGRAHGARVSKKVKTLRKSDSDAE